MQFLKTLLVASSALLSLAPAYAWDGVVGGRVTQFETVGSAGSAPGNYDFRVHLDAQVPICPGAIDTTWGYVNVSDANYKGIMASILMAYALGKTVTLFTTKSAGGYCQIGYLSVSG